MSKIQLVAIAGNATSGKDTAYSIFQKLLKEYNITTDRIGLGDFVKSELSEHCKQYNISPFTKDIKEKTLLRDLMVAHGKIHRQISQGKHYTSLATPRLLENIKENILTFVTDCRYVVFPEDEYSWVKSNNGVLVYIERTLTDGRVVPPANKDEEFNNTRLKELADYKLFWPTTDIEDIRIDCIKLQLDKLIERIINEKK
jgi:hypothetical protein